ncbi:MAG: histidine phosphatase family protein [Clostridium sp.]
MITNIYFVRHAEPDYSVHDDFSRPLTDKGKKDVLKVNSYLDSKNIEVAFSSPYKRAIDTIRSFVDKNKLEIEVIDDFRERKIDSCWIEDFEEFSRKQWDDFNYKLSDGECLNEVQQRNISALEVVLKRFSGKNIVIGTHGTALSTIINYYESNFGYNEFNQIRLCMPWIVKFTFEGNKYIEMEKINEL